MLENPLSLFLHFSIATFLGVDAPCDHTCPPARDFRPESNEINTSNWAATAAAMTAKEACLTAHHSAGFAMWRTNLTDYGLVQSSWAGDVASSFYKSAIDQGIRPCLYFDLSDASHPQDNSSENEARQRAFLEELLSARGESWSRLWLDDYFSTPFWPKMAASIRNSLSPSTLMIPGADGWYDGPSTGNGEYPLWLNANTSDGTPFGAVTSMGPFGNYFRVRESDMTIQQESDGARARWFWENKAPYLSARQLFDKYISSVGTGGSLIINIPPNVWGGIGPTWFKLAQDLGNAINASFLSPTSTTNSSTHVQCNTSEAITLDIPSSSPPWNVVILKEDLSHGQRISSYTIEVLQGSSWTTLPSHGATVGARVFDILKSTPTNATKIRARCLTSTTDDAYFRSLAISTLHPPP